MTSLRFFHLAMLLVAFTAAARDVIPANDGWKFFAGDPTGAEMPEFDDSGWTAVRLPHDFQISQLWVERVTPVIRLPIHAAV